MFYKKLDIDTFREVQDQIVPYVIDFVTNDVRESENKFSEKVSFNFISDEDLIRFKRDRSHFQHNDWIHLNLLSFQKFC